MAPEQLRVADPVLLGLNEHHPTDEIFRQLLDAGPDALVVIDAEGRVLFANLQTERLFDYARGALLGKGVEVLVPERLRATHVGHRSHFVAAPHVRPMGSGLTLVGRKRDGSEFPVEISLSPLTTPNGLLFSASIRDITQRKRDELEALRIQEQLRSAIESIPGSYAIFDSGDRLVSCNGAYRRLMGKGVAGNTIGLTFEELLAASVQAGTFQLDVASGPLSERWIAYHASPTGTLDVRTPGGQELQVVERRTPEGGIVTTIFDITEAVARETQLRRSQALAEGASAAKSEFLASMSHELRTPLNTILGFAQLLQRDKKTPLSARQKERAEHVISGGEHLLRLIDDVLDLARIDAGRVMISPERVDLAELLAEVKATLVPASERAEIQVVVEAISVEAAGVIADRTRLKQVLMNYGSNAIKYGRPHGTARFLVGARGGVVSISVVDDGIGIALDKQAAIFQPFHRAGREAGPILGMGIGLVISKRLAELMGGTVGFESTEGGGSRFWIELLRAPERAAGAAPSGTAKPEMHALAGSDAPHHVIVYVEDNPSNIAFMQDLLADFARVELITAPTAEIGIELVRARKPDIVIMDINLPGMSGVEASRLLAQSPETRGIPIIALSSTAMTSDAARMAGARFYRYLAKPVKVAELVATLEGLLDAARRPLRA